MSRDLPEGVTREKIWDPGLRLFHWTLALLVCAAWGLGKFGPNVMTLHFYCGYAVIALLGFRLIWGVIGPEAARFSHFAYGPATTGRYVARLGRREPSYWPGHNPLGALSVFALLGMLMVQVGSGLFSDPDDYINVGPLADMVDREARRSATWVHSQVAWVILGLVGAHLAAIVFYRRFKGEDLVTPMITGWKLVRRNRSQ